jgi:hypothetical protein
MAQSPAQKVQCKPVFDIVTDFARRAIKRIVFGAGSGKIRCDNIKTAG